MEEIAPSSTSAATQIAAQHDGPEMERLLAELRTANAELQRRRTDAEKDRDFFREQYGRASAHAGDVARENGALLERAERAEGAAADGVRMLGAAHDERVRRLEAELAKARARCAVLEAQAVRTDDEVRRRAALAPELAVENAQLRAQLEDALEQLAEWQAMREDDADSESDLPPMPSTPGELFVPNELASSQSTTVEEAIVVSVRQV